MLASAMPAAARGSGPAYRAFAFAPPLLGEGQPVAGNREFNWIADLGQ